MYSFLLKVCAPLSVLLLWLSHRSGSCDFSQGGLTEISLGNNAKLALVYFQENLFNCPCVSYDPKDPQAVPCPFPTRATPADIFPT